MSSENIIFREEIKWKLNRSKLTAIYQANQCLTFDLFEKLEDQVLMQALLYSLQKKIAKKLLDNKKEFTLTFTVSEAIAFKKLHFPFSANYDMYTFAAINPLLSDIQSKLI